MIHDHLFYVNTITALSTIYNSDAHCTITVKNNTDKTFRSASPTHPDHLPKKSHQNTQRSLIANIYKYHKIKKSDASSKYTFFQHKKRMHAPALYTVY